MWADAAKRLNRFGEAVLTAFDAHGYPISVRVPTGAYDPATGELPAVLPAELGAVEGPANLLCHFHDEKLWRLDSAQVIGRLERRGSGWAFVSQTYRPRSRWYVLTFLRNNNRAALRYLDRRGLDRPTVNWAAVQDIRQGK
ncbi:hypothetical protein C6A87_020925 [Mycobacterium sp. ITM-2016-00317]|uniref:hypothetical protein n=1 Tax=Mycobacterium sp. ITM-2016-00317 TaxID=2099694 RepID=UPI000D457E14|nr:hypothetical protein [Mycobacterium sp. ITM-2016-00317]WNG86303.1 hypothetical protein C6A87_020925 [Mycobacterium sp. ITM-2016-00317]